MSRMLSFFDAGVLVFCGSRHVEFGGKEWYVVPVGLIMASWSAVMVHPRRGNEGGNWRLFSVLRVSAPVLEPQEGIDNQSRWQVELWATGSALHLHILLASAYPRWTWSSLNNSHRGEARGVIWNLFQLVLWRVKNVNGDNRQFLTRISVSRRLYGKCRRLESFGDGDLYYKLFVRLLLIGYMAQSILGCLVLTRNLFLSH